VSPLLAAGIVIVLAAAALFFLPSFLLGLGGDDAATPTPSASGAAASAPPEGSPSPSPAPTPFVYTVKSGDTLSGIATQFDVTLDDLIAANPELKDPDMLGVGDKLIIPIGGFQPSPSPSPSPVEASPSP
jgi:LysM repeat protein